ncbi:hypothetical protein M514_03320 [Trichuris suis]|uniref:Uncharacterized protein n=1 Tax=Trichuris suis TaxID=68888 RepID=A0A085NL74_9BILA|nr:hypothetical protein M513_03320 [Trichuris suis]KFD70220.1 hypothetical protein M514_03320 [Trichuris suis]
MNVRQSRKKADRLATAAKLTAAVKWALSKGPEWVPVGGNFRFCRGCNNVSNSSVSHNDAIANYQRQK